MAVVVLKFKYTCARHQALFIEAAAKAGITDPAQLELLRKRLLAWLSNEYPRMVLDHYARASCIACDLEAAGIGLGDMRRALDRLAGAIGKP